MVSLEPDTLVGLVAVVTLPAAALAELFVSSAAAGTVAIVGWLLLVPTLAILPFLVRSKPRSALEAPGR